MKACVNHPDKKAVSVCHHCGKDYCGECLTEGREYYYCFSPECREALEKEIHPVKLPENINCPGCGNKIEISDTERITAKVHCPNCEALVDFNSDPPEVMNKENYAELLSSFNQGDISLIKSVLDNSDIDYYVFGENFLSVDPLIQPARFFVNVKDMETARELLKDFDLRIWGTSTDQF